MTTNFSRANLFVGIESICASVENLEDRIAPAGVFTYSDVDGDFVTIKSTKGTDADLAAAITPGIAASGFGQQVESISLDLNPTVFQGTSLTIAAKRTSVGGDGFVNVGVIFASGIDLGQVKIHGDLGRIAVGDADTTTPAIKSLDLQSMGLFGVTTGASNLVSSFYGALGSLVIKDDLKSAYLLVSGNDDVDGKIGKVSIGGSLVGGDFFFENGSIFASGNIGAVKIGRDVVGGLADDSGVIHSGGSIQSVTVGGSVRGGEGDCTDGQIFGFAGIGSVKIGGDLAGGAGTNSARIYTVGDITSVSIGASIIGGSGTQSGRLSADNDIKSIKIGDDLRGGTSVQAGAIFCSGYLGTLSIGGSVLGGTINGTASIYSVGGTGKVTIGGDIHGGGNSAGSIGSTGFTGSLTIDGSLIGGTGTASGNVSSFGFGTVKIGGSVVGGTGESSGLISNNGFFCGSITIGGSLLGSSVSSTGGFSSTGDVDSLKIGGNVVGGSLTGAANLTSSGFIFILGRVASLEIGGSVVAGFDNGAGSLLGGNGSIRVGEDIGTLKIKGNLTGNETNRVLITAGGSETPMGAKDSAFGSISIGGSVELAKILAGYNATGTGIAGNGAINGDAQIGKVTIGGSWIRSSMSAGTNDAGDDLGNGNDTALSGGAIVNTAERVSQIAAVLIKGQIIGTLNTAGNFGFVAQEIKSFNVGATNIPLTSGASNDTSGVNVSASLDVFVREIA